MLRPLPVSLPDSSVDSGAQKPRDVRIHLLPVHGKVSLKQIELAPVGSIHDVPTIKAVKPIGRTLQKELNNFDAFVCHAGPDKRFALALCKRLPRESR